MPKNTQPVLSEEALKQKEILRERAKRCYERKLQRLAQKKQYGFASRVTIKYLRDEVAEVPPVCQKTSDGSLVFCGKIENTIYKIILNEKNSRFFAVHKNKLSLLPAENLGAVFLHINEHLNQSGELDDVLAYFATKYKAYNRLAQQKLEKNMPCSVTNWHQVVVHRQQLCQLLAPQMFEKYMHMREE